MAGIPDWYLTCVAGVFGLLVGSFLNVVIYRIPAGHSLMGRSHCTNCGQQIRNRDNVPVLAWALLRGRCRDCRAPISWRYPAVEGAHALAWAALAAWLGWSPLLPLMLFFASVSIALAMIDFDTFRLPNVIVYPSTVIVLVYLTGYAAISGQWGAWTTAMLCAVGYLAFFGILFTITRGRGLGLGDVKLSLCLGAITGWLGVGPALIGLFAAFVIGGVPAMVLLATGVLKRKQSIPFGPFLLLGAWVGIIWGQQLAGIYLDVTGLS